MKYLHLIWAALFRRKTRTILTLLSIIMAFLLFGMLDAVRISFAEAGQSANGAERLQTGARLSFIQTLPKIFNIRLIDVKDGTCRSNQFLTEKGRNVRVNLTELGLLIESQLIAQGLFGNVHDIVLR
ncbi:MAG TPA: hypothetical protein PK173_10020, partial [Dokdonella sp.]|nr:hypothetical protein [Dokdonella sp.]